MGQGQFFVARVRSRSGRVSHLWFGFEFGKFPLKTFFPSGRVKKYPGRSQVGLLFTTGHK